MPDIDVFDPVAFFTQRIRELEQEMIAKKARVEILLTSKANLDRALQTLANLPEDQQKALQVEIASLNEARAQAQRAIDALTAEIELQSAKLAALRAASALLTEDNLAVRRQAAGEV